MKYFFWIFCLFFVSLFASADIYKWVDEKGRVHYGDKPTEKEKKVAVDISSYESVTYSDPPDMNVKSISSAPTKSAIKKKVTMYSTAWCGYCKKARNYFQAQGIPFIEYDIEKNSTAKKDYDALGGRGVPVIVMGKKRMNGFSQEGFERFYQ